MRKPITYVNIALLLAALWLAAGIRATWSENHARYARFARTPAAGPSAASPGGAPPQLGTVSYSELVTRNLFSADRSNVQPVSKVEKKLAPPVPYVVGTMNLGSGMIALMADQKQAAQQSFRRVKVGDEVGGYRVAEIAEHKVVIEFEGEKTTIDVYESAASVPGAAGSAAASYAPAAAKSEPQVVSAVNDSGPAAQPPSPAPQDAAARLRPPPGSQSTEDPYLTYTIEGDYKVYRRATPFGVQTWKEQIRPGTKK